MSHIESEQVELAAVRRGDGPLRPVAALAGRGAVSESAWMLRVPKGRGLVRAELVGTGIEGPIGSDDRLRWQLHPEGGGAPLDSLWDATIAAVDLEFDDGTRLSAVPGIVDQYGGRITADEQGAAQRSWVDQWNLRTVDLAPAVLAAPRAVRRVLVTVRRSPRRALTVFVDDIGIGRRPVEPVRPIDHVRTTRGSQSSFSFSRGNTAPLVAVPHGGVFGLPMTDASAADWPYTWHAAGGEEDGRPVIQAFATSHIPSPWMGDRGVLQVMPSRSLAPEPSREGRALGFDHSAEHDGPHLYEVELDGGLVASMTAGDFALGLRFAFPDPSGSIILDHRGTVDEVRIDRKCTGLTIDLRLDDRPGTPPHFVHLRVDGVLSEHLDQAGGGLRGWIVVDGSSGPVDVLIGISTVDAATAAADLAAAGGFDRMLSEAERRWEEVLSTVEVRGATEDQRVSLYSGLYRLFLHPSRYGESPDAGVPRSRSPYGSVLSSPIRDDPAEEIVEGPYSSTNGFWDTYRTAWPLLGLLTPVSAGALAQGFVQHHLDGGWTPRWSAPGAEDVMTGTTSDTVFADLLVKGVPGLDLEQAYESAITNATVPARDARVGRKGLHPGVFRGFVDTDTDEGMSWTLDAAINDWGVSRLAALMAARHETGTPERDRYEVEAEWFARRSAQYRTVFDRDRGFFVGRRPDGSWRVPAETFDPDEWGHDYTETNAWGTAFTAPHDGAGIAELHGAETGSPEKAGSYGSPIHEMTEARDIRRGMFGLSNQPAHHIPFMYSFAGRHDDAHRVVRDALDRLFVGSDNGQGYPGDEDNGEMSAWWIFATIGLYPLAPASGTYLLLPPAVESTVLRPHGGRPITIVVTNPEVHGRYIRRVVVDGTEWTEVSVDHARLVAGATIEFELSAEPTGWAADSRPFSASDLHGHRRPIQDATEGAVVTGSRDAAALVDDTAATIVDLAAGESVVFHLAHPVVRVGLYTLTIAEPGPASWTVQAIGRDDSVLGEDRRSLEVFERSAQTRVFRFADPGSTEAVLGVRLTARAPLRIRQFEVIG